MNQRKFILSVSASVIIFIIAALSIFLAIQHKQNQDLQQITNLPSPTSEKNYNIAEIREWKTYRNEVYKIEFKYPSEFYIEEYRSLDEFNLSLYINSPTKTTTGNPKNHLNFIIECNGADSGIGPISQDNFGITVSTSTLPIGDVKGTLYNFKQPDSWKLFIAVYDDLKLKSDICGMYITSASMDPTTDFKIISTIKFLNKFEDLKNELFEKYSQ
jgi:hypothetical protein